MIIRGSETEAVPAPVPVGSLGWSNFLVETPRRTRQMHVVPRNDIRPHMLCEHCACAPVEDADTPDMWAHQSWDGRESYERGRPRH